MHPVYAGVFFLRDDVGVFKFEATRGGGLTSISEKSNPKFIKKLLFELPKTGKVDHYLHYMPPIQICFYSQDSMSLSGYKIVFPDEYNNDYVL